MEIGRCDYTNRRDQDKEGPFPSVRLLRRHAAAERHGGGPTDNTIVYTARPGFTRGDSCTVAATDPVAGTESAECSITVTPGTPLPSPGACPARSMPAWRCR